MSIALTLLSFLLSGAGEPYFPLLACPTSSADIRESSGAVGNRMDVHRRVLRAEENMRIIGAHRSFG